MFSRKSSENLITLSLTEAAFILVFAVLVLIGSRLVLIAHSSNQCRADLQACSQDRDSCRSEVSACKTQLKRITAKPDEMITDLVNAGRLRDENEALKTKLLAASQEVQALNALKDRLPKESPVRVQTALQLLDGFEHEKGESVAMETARMEGQEAAKAAKGLQNCLGQLKNCTKALGPRGYGLPPCWTDNAGKVQYLFNVELQNDGVIITAGWDPERDTDAKALPGALELTKLGVISLDQFQLRTAEIFQVSRKSNPECRHYVRLRRSTSLKDIDLFNRLRLGVEDHFYKLDLTNSGS